MAQNSQKRKGAKEKSKHTNRGKKFITESNYTPPKPKNQRHLDLQTWECKTRPKSQHCRNHTNNVHVLSKSCPESSICIRRPYQTT